MAAQYRKFLKLLERWPIDSSKKGRDLGEFLREQVKVKFSAGALSQADTLECERQYSSLKRLADNTYGKAYSRQIIYTASGLKTEEELKTAVSNEFFEYLDRGGDGGFIQKLKFRFLSK